MYGVANLPSRRDLKERRAAAFDDKVIECRLWLFTSVTLLFQSGISCLSGGF